jgi:lipopolysaccharide export system protein LptA
MVMRFYSQTQNRLSLYRVPVALVVLLLVLPLATIAQKRVKLEHADKLKRGVRNTEKYERLLGNVVFTQNKTTIYCDSAHFFKEKNSITAFGRIRITEGDSVTVTAANLEYDGNLRKAKLRKNVVFTKLATATLYTDFLDYDRPSNIAYYFNNGKLVDSVNTLTSFKGYYNLNTNLSAFKKEVVVINPDYSMYADSLQYNSGSKIIYFVTPTTVIDKDSSRFVYEEGQYNTQEKKSNLQKGAGESASYKISGNQYSLDDQKKIYRVRGNVVMTSKEQNLIIYGQASDAYRLQNIAKVYNNAYLAKITEEGDTLFLSADTLVSIDSTDPKKKRVLAYNNVKIYKKDLQGIADSLEYRLADSLLVFYKKPVLWTNDNQMSADSVSMQIENNTIKRIFLKTHAFVVSEDTVINDYNQIKGRTMVAELKNRKIDRVQVNGNAENLYFALDEKTKAMMGMNKIICSSILIRFKDGKLDTFHSYVKPEAFFIPPHELNERDKKLKGFTWQADKRPKRENVVKK